MSRAHVRRNRITRSVVLFATVVALLASGSRSEDPQPWGEAAEEFFVSWANAWSAGNVFDTVRFYAADVALHSAQPDLELTNAAAYRDTTTQGVGRGWLARWLTDQTRPRTRSIAGVYVDRTSAAVLVTMEDLDTTALYIMDVDRGEIVRQTTLRWRDAHKPGGIPDERLASVDELVARWVDTWSNPNQAGIETAYDSRAVIQPFPGDPIRGVAGIVEQRDELALEAPRIARVDNEVRKGPALFVVPGATTTTVAFIAESGSDGGACRARTAVLLRLDGTTVVDERRFPDPDTIRRCHDAGRGPEGWWTDLGVPPPVDRQITGSVAQSSGPDIVIFNGAATLEGLLSWGLGRFENAGLEPPALSSVTFGPVPECGDARAGSLAATGDGPPRLVLCTDAYDACGGAGECTEYALTSRMGLLHELAHAWLVEAIDDSTRTAFLDFADLTTWHDPEIAWHLNGVEHAADTMAWGLLDARVALIRLGNPPCDVSASGFLLLTGAGPSLPCA